MSPVTYLITGASRGLGLETTRQLLAQSKENRVIAGVRSPSTSKLILALQDEYPGRIELLQLDVSDTSSVSKAAEAVKSLSFAADGIDVLLNNAGVCWDVDRFADHPDLIPSLQDHWQTNVVGVVAVTQAFLPLLRAKEGGLKKVWITSSSLGSHVHPANQAPYAVAYCVSKAAVNMYGSKLAAQLGPEGFLVALFHPGFVTTDMNADKNAEISPEESVSKSLKALQALTAKDNGAYINYEDGSQIGW